MTTFDIVEGFAIDDDLAEAFAWMAGSTPIAWEEGDENDNLEIDGFTLSIVRVTSTDADILIKYYGLDFVPTFALIPLGDQYAQFTYEMTLGNSLTELIELAEPAYSVRMVTE